MADNIVTETPVPVSDAHKKLRSWLLGKLGYPTVKVELTETQIDICIQDALDEVAPWIVQPQYITVPYQSCIDVAEYQMDYVINVIKASLQDRYSNMDMLSTDPFSRQYYSPYGNDGSCPGCSLEKQLLYGALANITFDRTRETFKDNMSFTFIKDQQKLYIDVGYPKSDNVTIKYSPIISDVSVITDVRYIKYMKDFALAFARGILADIRSKFTDKNSAIELDGNRQDSKSDAEVTRLREELKKSVPPNFMID